MLMAIYANIKAKADNNKKWVNPKQGNTRLKLFELITCSEKDEMRYW